MSSHNSYPLVDIGANLSHESFSGHLDQVIDEAMQVGIEHIMVTGTSVTGSQDAFSLTEKYEDFLSSTCGVHPHEAHTCDKDALTALQDMAENNKVKAVGETGLDYFRDFSPATSRETPLLHNWNWQSILTCLYFSISVTDTRISSEFCANTATACPAAWCIVLQEPKRELEDYLELDMHIGITGWICDERRGHHLHEIVDLVPENRLMLETDAPYLMPRNIRPKPKTRRNDPANLVWVLKTVAECLNKSEKAVAESTTANARDFFNL